MSNRFDPELKGTMFGNAWCHKFAADGVTELSDQIAIGSDSKLAQTQADGAVQIGGGMNDLAGSVKIGSSQVELACVAEYDFDTDGGVVGTIEMRGTELPDNAVIVGGIMEVITPLTSGGAATVEVRAEGADDVVADAAIGGAPWSTGGLKDIVPDFTAANAVKIDGAKQLSCIISTADLTAGAFKVYAKYIVGD